MDINSVWIMKRRTPGEFLGTDPIKIKVSVGSRTSSQTAATTASDEEADPQASATPPGPPCTQTILAPGKPASSPPSAAPADTGQAAHALAYAAILSPLGCLCVHCGSSQAVAR